MIGLRSQVVENRMEADGAASAVVLSASILPYNHCTLYALRVSY
jgi:hypothetical protein